jgi:ATP-binding cassette, subfamily B, bacterial PglK
MVFVEVFRALWRMLEPRRRLYLVLLMALLLVSGLFEMGGMMIIFGFIRGLHVDPESGLRGGKLAHAMERVLHNPLSDSDYAIYGGGAVVVCFLVKNVQSLVVRYHLTRFLANLNQRVGLQLFAALATLPYEEAVRGGLLALEKRLEGTLELLAANFRHATQIVASGATLLTLLALLGFIDPGLTGLFALLFGLFGFTQNRLLGNKLRALDDNDRVATTAAHAHLKDTFGGLVEARLRDRISYFQSLYGQALGVQMRINRKLAAWSRVPGAANELLLVLAIVIAVLTMALRGSGMEAALPVFAAFGFAGMRSVSSIAAISKSYQVLTIKSGRFKRAMKELERLAPRALGSENTDVPSYLAEERPLPDGRDGRLHRQIELKGVTFRYPRAKRRALNKVSLKIKRGQFASFCGPSGSGKSTLVMLLVGLLKPTSGDVRCDEWNVFEHIRAWQKNIGYVGQFAYLSAASVRQNVAFGVAPADIDDARVWAALELAAARTFVEQLAEGLATELADEGGGLSGGQRQRILIARALYHDPDIVVFDEATAALDNVTEREITEAAIRLSRAKTVICVAHRLSTIERSDVIFVMDQGRVVAKGKYDELIASNETFRQLASLPEPSGPSAPVPP